MEGAGCAKCAETANFRASGAAPGQGTVTPKSLISRPTPPFQISKPANTLVRYQLGFRHLVVPEQLRAIASWMKSPRLNDHEVKSCCATYETHGLLPFMPYQMVNCLPPIVKVPFGIAAPIGWFMGESLNHTIRKPPLGADADGSPPEPVLNQTS